MKTRTLAALSLILLLGVAGLKRQTDLITRTRVPGSSFIYIPSGKYLSYASFGYSTLMADLIYLWAIQYFSDTAIPHRFEAMDHIFSIIAELDPRYLDPYEIGALIAVYDARDPELAYTILDRGLEKNPDQWIFPLQAGHYAAMTAKDFETARMYYKKAMDIPGAPPITRRLYANAAFKVMDYQTAWGNWLEIYQTAEDDRIKSIAANHLYQVKASLDIQNLTEAVDVYRSRLGRSPDTLEALVEAKILREIPKDLDGNDYIYDRQYGEITPPSSPWKR